MGNKKRYALGLSYKGANYLGFQTQTQNNSIQEMITQAIALVANHDIKIMCAGRTDKGVHALLQIVHFDTESKRANEQWVRGINTHLPSDIKALWIKEVDTTFHARFSAYERGYVYVLNTKNKDLFMEAYSWHIQAVDIDKMREASQCLIGTHDFYAFQSKHCQSSHSFREIKKILFKQERGLIYCHIEANAFLHHMVRKIMATLVKAGQGKLTPCQVQSILVNKDRDSVPGQAPSKGLFLKKIVYDASWGLSQTGCSQLLGGSDV